jgi:putative tryptophan/tyrosine transport system substrate-binding protein
MEDAAQVVGVQLKTFQATGQDDFEAVFARLVEQRRHELVALAARHSIPAIYEWREFVEAGGLMSHGASLKDAYRQIGLYAGRILRGANASGSVPSAWPPTVPTGQPRCWGG